MVFLPPPQRWEVLSTKGCSISASAPPLNPAPERRVEIHLFDFDRQIYNQDITVEIYKFIRGDRKFPSMEGLKAAMSEDEIAVRRFFNGSFAASADVATVILNYNGKQLPRAVPSLLPIQPFST